VADIIDRRAGGGGGNVGQLANYKDVSGSGYRAEEVAVDNYGWNATSLAWQKFLIDNASGLLQVLSSAGAATIPTSTTMQNAAAATGNGTTLNVSGYAVAIVQVTGTFSATITFEASTDDATWTAILAHSIGTGGLSSTATAVGDYRISTSGYKSIRARISTYVSGNVTAKGWVSALTPGLTTIQANQAGTWTVQPGNTANTTAWKVDNSAVTQPISAAASSLAQSTVLATNLVVKASAGTLYGITITNSRTSSQFFQIHNTTSLPADTAVPVFTIYMAATTSVALDFGLRGMPLSTGITVCNSTTLATKTVGAADCWFSALYA